MFNIDFSNLVDWIGYTKTPAGVRGRGDSKVHSIKEAPRYRPRKAKCLERKSTAKFNTALKKEKTPEDPSVRLNYFDCLFMAFII